MEWFLEVSRAMRSNFCCCCCPPELLSMSERLEKEESEMVPVLLEMFKCCAVARVDNGDERLHLDVL